MTITLNIKPLIQKTETYTSTENETNSTNLRSGQKPRVDTLENV